MPVVLKRVGKLLLLGFLGAGLASAEAPAGHSQWHDAATDLALHDNWRWLQLGHYQPRRTGKPVSDIHSAGFFLAPEGARDPELELHATIEAFFAPPGEDPEQHAQCRFPARLLWLREHLPQVDDLPTPRCEGYDRWRGQDERRIESVSLIAVEGYLRNPSSLYGHILLRLNESAREPAEHAHVLANTVNFGVDLPPGESPLQFISKGLFGGYEAVFSHARFHQNSVLYGDYQQRDLWEYRLQLTPEQTALVVAHTWELLGREFSYYFAGSNCAYRTAAILNLILPEDESLDNRIKPWTMPHDTFNHLMRVDNNGASMVSAVYYYPSPQSELLADWQHLSRTQRAAASAWLESGDPELITDERFSLLEQQQLLDALINYHAAQTASPASGLSDADWRTLMALRVRLPVRTDSLGDHIYTEPSSAQSSRDRMRHPAPMHAANYPTLLSASGLWNETRGPGVEARFRLSYYDLLARPVGRPALAELSMVDIRAAAWEDGLQLRRLDLINATALNLSATGRLADQPMSGRLRAGYEASNLACNDCGEWFVEGGPGLAFGSPGLAAGYGLLEGRLASGDSGPVAVTPRLGWLQHWHSAFSTGLEAGYRWSAGDSDSAGPLLDARLRFGNSQRWDLRLEGQWHQASEFRVGLGTYW
ncbi:MAG: DUF4105 domain-containing protein [Natronospirillum sp.]|uniref:Lnb N-terminal periplasmic domain-containing protein n=1 Tax=Natronospirillum sp. TaxID=2812955 RepID=UPI0025E896F8|nr:DUF4105 domain-containing protein [Natronospirillum sp.]MCH8551196.1 DUF4105 domain-containing protein [Natronospirillum sp.]